MPSELKDWTYQDLVDRLEKDYHVFPRKAVKFATTFLSISILIAAGTTLVGSCQLAKSAAQDVALTVARDQATLLAKDIAEEHATAAAKQHSTEVARNVAAETAAETARRIANQKATDIIDQELRSRSIDDYVSRMREAAQAAVAQAHSIKQLFQDLRTRQAELDEIPVGTIVAFAGTAPNQERGIWMACDGQTIECTEEPNLCHALANTRFCQDSVCRLPDLRSQFIRGASSSHPVGSTQRSAIATHYHHTIGAETTDNPLQRDTAIAIGTNTVQQSHYELQGTLGTATLGRTSEPHGTLTSNESYPQNVALVFMIKVKRVWE